MKSVQKRYSPRSLTDDAGKPDAKPLGQNWLHDFLRIFDHVRRVFLGFEVVRTNLGADPDGSRRANYSCKRQTAIDQAVALLEDFMECEFERREDPDSNALAYYVRALVAAFQRLAAAQGSGEVEFTLPQAGLLVAVGKDGRMATRPSDFTTAITVRLWEALSRIDPRRITACAICFAFFVAPRLRSTCCSPRCSNVQRQRAFYTRSKALDEAVTKLLSDGKTVDQIARSLKITTAKARSMVRIKREEHGKTSRTK